MSHILSTLGYVLFPTVSLTFGSAIFSQEPGCRQGMVFSCLGVPSTLGNPQGVCTATKSHREPTVCGLSQTAAFLLAELAGALLSQSFKNKDKFN